MLMRLDEDGRTRWIRFYGGEEFDRILHVTQMQDGGFAMVGSSRPQRSGNLDLVVHRVDGDGKLRWSHREGGSHPDVGKDIITARDGSLIVVGGTRSETPPLDDIILLRLRDD